MTTIHSLFFIISSQGQQESVCKLGLAMWFSIHRSPQTHAVYILVSEKIHSLYALCVTLYPFTEGSGLALLSLNSSHYGQGERLSDTVISVTLVCVCVCLGVHLFNETPRSNPHERTQTDIRTCAPTDTHHCTRWNDSPDRLYTHTHTLRGAGPAPSGYSCSVIETLRSKPEDKTSHSLSLCMANVELALIVTLTAELWIAFDHS